MWSDCETRDDCLGFCSYVKVLADICVEKEIAPLALGIFGSWGSGKTSLMKMLKDTIDQFPENTKIRSIWFNAWRYEGKEEAQSALIHSIINKLEEGKTLGQDIKDNLKKLKDGAGILKLAKFIGKTAITLTPDIGGFVDCFRDESEKISKTMEHFEKDFEEVLFKMQISRIVVFIDDLDRCQSAKVIEVFETIKLFLNIPECTFVIGADSDKIEQAISGTYSIGKQDGALFAKDYLEKIIQLPFRIPEQRLPDIACYVGMLILRRHLEKDVWLGMLKERASLITKSSIMDGFVEWVIKNKDKFVDTKIELPTNQLKQILPYVDILARGLRGNPRQIKRFLNILDLRHRLAEENHLKITPDLLIKLTVLEYAWPKFFEELVETFDFSTGKTLLLDEIIKTKGSLENVTDSPSLKAALEIPGLYKFIEMAPNLSKADLSPYLFLAQTSLGSQQVTALTSLDETAKFYIDRISSDDRVRSDAAARQASKLEPSAISAIIRPLITRMVSAPNEKTLTHIIIGLDTICRQHSSCYGDVIKGMESVQFASGTGSALAANTFVANANKAKISVPVEFEDKIKKLSPSAQAITPKKKG